MFGLDNKILDFIFDDFGDFGGGELELLFEGGGGGGGVADWVLTGYWLGGGEGLGMVFTCVYILMRDEKWKMGDEKW